MLAQPPYMGQTIKILAPERLAGKEAIVTRVGVPHKSSGYGEPYEPTEIHEYNLDVRLPNGRKAHVGGADAVEIDPRLTNLDAAIESAFKIRDSIIARGKGQNAAYSTSQIRMYEITRFDQQREDCESRMNIGANAHPIAQNAKLMVKAADQLRSAIHIDESPSPRGWGRKETSIFLGRNIEKVLKNFDRTASETGYDRFHKLHQDGISERRSYMESAD